MTGTTLYVSNLPFSATEQELGLKFGSCGSVVTVKLVVDTSTGRSKRFGFVKMASPTEALAAIRRLNLTTYDGRLMSVNLAQAKNGASQPVPVRAAPVGRAQ